MKTTTLVMMTSFLAASAAATVAMAAAIPPPLLNYQGVLRDSNGVPITGSRDMTFRFFDDPNAGAEILVDNHTGAGAVAVDGGLFNVTLGGGVVSDGSGPGFYGTLWAVFSNYDHVWLQIQVAGETLSPRVRLLSAAYALNTSHVGGLAANQILNTTSTKQVKDGELAATTLSVFDDSTFNTVAFIDELGNLGVGGSVQIGWDPNQGGSALSFSNGGFVVAEPGITRIVGRDTFDGIVQLQAGSGSSSSFSVDGNPTGPGAGIEMQSADGIFNFNGSIVPFGSVSLTNRTSSSMIQMQPGGMTLLAGSANDYDMILIAGNDPTDGGISILGDSDFTLTSGNGLFNFVAGSTGTNTAQLASNGDLQIDGSLTACCNSAGSATLAIGSRGILARGSFGVGDVGEAGRFCDSGFTGEAEIADGNTGLVGYGSFSGGIFRHRTSSNINCTATAFDNEVRLATATSGIETSAPKNFVQNHPYDPTKLVVYTSLEGDEVGTYTRGVGRLHGGVAHVPLGETFAWVTNPGLGLTAHVTPRGEWNDLYVESVTTSELVVRSRDVAAEGAFDYIVHGLRVGFEEASVVRERDVDAFIPSMAPHEDLYAREPALRSLNAGERFKTMQGTAGERIDLGGGLALAAAIGVHDPAFPPRNQLLGGPIGSAPVAHSEPPIGAASTARPSAVVAGAESPAAASTDVRDPGEAVERATDPCRRVAGCALFLVGERIETGELLTLDPIGAERLTITTTQVDPGIVGVALDAATEVGGRRLVPVISAGVVVMKVDAGFGSVRAGDLLTSSPTPGHAMRSDDAQPGTIVGKALQSLDAGMGLIRVLVMPR